MRKFKLNKENKSTEPSPEQIKRQKDFSRLHHQYEVLTKRGKKPIYKDPKRLLFFILIGIILYLIFSEYK
jgi:hypothetical protein